VVQAGFGEHGRAGLQELCEVPVVDITEPAGHVASLLGHKYSVVTTLDRTVPLIEDRLKLAGLDARCASVRSSGMSVLELEERPEDAVKAIVAEAKLAVTEDGAEVICLGCGGMAGLDEAAAAATSVPVVDGVTAARQTRRGPRRARPDHQQDKDFRRSASKARQRLAHVARHRPVISSLHDSEKHDANPRVRPRCPGGSGS
jgi:Asp/Glu/hydantoin racemase